MAVSLGTNSGFVTVAPTTAPGGSQITIDGVAAVTKDTSPADATKIIEVGWYCNEDTEETNYEIALYAADGAVVPGEAGTRLFIDATNAKGTTAGWKVVTGLNWTISPSTDYWIGLQVDAVATTTHIPVNFSSAAGFDTRTPSSALANPFGGGALGDGDGAIAIYALYEVLSNIKSLDTNVKSNIKSYNTNVIANVKSINTNV